MKLHSVTEPGFAQYGRVLQELQPEYRQELTDALRRLPLTRQVVYTASEPSLEALPSVQWIGREIFGEIPVQAGWCNGYNRAMNAMEYHKASEVNFMSEDAILLLGRLQDVQPYEQYDTALAEAFLVPAGTAIEVYGTTLHYAPIHTGQDGFRTLVMLPRQTNTPLQEKHESRGESRLLLAKNKWLIGHPDAELEEGCWRGLQGENLDFGPLDE